MRRRWSAADQWSAWPAKGMAASRVTSGWRCPEVQNRLAEIQVGSLGHAAQEVAEALAVGLLQGLVQPGFQGQAPGVGLVASPGKPDGAVAGEAAGDSRVQGNASFPWPVGPFFSMV